MNILSLIYLYCYYANIFNHKLAIETRPRLINIWPGMRTSASELRKWNIVCSHQFQFKQHWYVKQKRKRIYIFLNLSNQKTARIKKLNSRTQFWKSVHIDNWQLCLFLTLHLKLYIYKNIRFIVFLTSAIVNVCFVKYTTLIFTYLTLEKGWAEWSCNCLPIYEYVVLIISNTYYSVFFHLKQTI